MAACSMPWNLSSSGRTSLQQTPSQFNQSAAARKFELHHPTLMCTAVMFDTGVFDTSTTWQAKFTEQRCMCWCQSGGMPEVINGLSGRPHNEKNSQYSRAAMFQHFCSVRGFALGQNAMCVYAHQYNVWKFSDEEYCAARAALKDVFQQLQP